MIVTTLGEIEGSGPRESGKSRESNKQAIAHYLLLMGSLLLSPMHILTIIMKIKTKIN